MTGINKSIFIMLLIFTGITGLPLINAADPSLTSENQTQTDPDDSSLLVDLFRNHFKYELRVLTYGLYQDPACSTQNPDNRFLELPRYKGDLEIRPDLRLDFDTVLLSAKPRMQLEYRSWQDGARKGESDWTDDWYLNEWLARLKLTENLFISYGRENLQWGPSFLFSPSNPFFMDNGRNNPKQEVADMDFGRLVWIPGQAWTISFIAHLDEGHNKSREDDFRKTYALKTDYTGRDFYGSLILSHRAGDRNIAGFFGGWTLSDAFLLYGEGAIRKGSRALYPKEDAGLLGASMEAVHQDDRDLRSIFLIGGSYTFENGGTLAMEYAYNSPGYSDREADQYCRLRGKAADAFSSGGVWSALSGKTLGRTADTGLKFLRKNYIMTQYNRNDIQDKLDVTLRWTQNLDDGSYQFIVIGGYSLGNHIELFAIGNLNGGHKDTEFRSILDRQWMLGVEYTF
jgi:hypothetical protein